MIIGRIENHDDLRYRILKEDGDYLVKRLHKMNKDQLLLVEQWEFSQQKVYVDGKEIMEQEEQFNKQNEFKESNYQLQRKYISDYVTQSKDINPMISSQSIQEKNNQMNEQQVQQKNEHQDNLNNQEQQIAEEDIQDQNDLIEEQKCMEQEQESINQIEIEQEVQEQEQEVKSNQYQSQKQQDYNIEQQEDNEICHEIEGMVEETKQTQSGHQPKTYSKAVIQHYRITNGCVWLKVRIENEKKELNDAIWVPDYKLRNIAPNSLNDFLMSRMKLIQKHN